MQSIVLFDLDGTLTPPRGKITDAVIQTLVALSERATLGIVTGSGMEYVREQATELLQNKEIRSNSELHVFPCNGTEHWKLSDTGAYDKVYGISMEEHMGSDKFRDMLAVLCTLQSDIVQLARQMPLSGHFVSNRQSMVNWCPIGRNASTEQREQFVEQDALQHIRFNYITSLIDSFLANDIAGLTVTLGGDTSFDIYPTGWDKTYVLKHEPCKQKNLYFIGDRCHGNGNDKTLHDLLNHPDGPDSWKSSVTAEGPKQKWNIPRSGRAWQTSGPEETIRILEGEIIPKLPCLTDS